MTKIELVLERIQIGSSYKLLNFTYCSCYLILVSPLVTHEISFALYCLLHGVPRCIILSTFFQVLPFMLYFSSWNFLSRFHFFLFYNPARIFFLILYPLVYLLIVQVLQCLTFYLLFCFYLMHVINFHQVKIVHICEATLMKRLIEFENTDSGSLTVC